LRFSSALKASNAPFPMAAFCSCNCTMRDSMEFEVTKRTTRTGRVCPMLLDKGAKVRLGSDVRTWKRRRHIPIDAIKGLSLHRLVPPSIHHVNVVCAG
jgi:hypothetical protein